MNARTDASDRTTRPDGRRVLLFAKAPRAGDVKTRLAREVGAAAAVTIYRWLVERQVSALPAGWPLEVHFAPADAAGEMRAWLGSAGECFSQCGDDLGARLTHAIAHAFARRAEPLLIIGGDCPTLDEVALREAGAALAQAEVVLGPAIDGGYYLIGLRQPAPELFTDIPWSSSMVLEQTLVRIRKARLTHVLLPRREDVDDLASWRRAQACGSADVQSASSFGNS